MNLEEELDSPQETFNSSEASGKCSGLLLVCGVTEPVCSHTPGLDPPSGAAGQISVDRHVVGPVSCFHLHQPVLLFTEHRFYRLSSSITRLKVPHVSDFIENVELAAIYRNIPCSLLVLHYYTFHFMFIFTFSYGNV